MSRVASMLNVNKSMLSRWIKQKPQLRTQFNSPDYGSRFRLRFLAATLHGKHPATEMKYSL